MWNDLKSKFLSLTLTKTFTCDYRLHSLFVNLKVKECFKCGEMRDAKTLNLSRNIVSLQVLGLCFAFLTLELHDQLVEQQSQNLSVTVDSRSTFRNNNSQQTVARQVDHVG